MYSAYVPIYTSKVPRLVRFERGTSSEFLTKVRIGLVQ